MRPSARAIRIWLIAIGGSRLFSHILYWFSRITVPKLNGRTPREFTPHELLWFATAVFITFAFIYIGVTFTKSIEKHANFVSVIIAAYGVMPLVLLVLAAPSIFSRLGNLPSHVITSLGVHVLNILIAYYLFSGVRRLALHNNLHAAT
ncbi:MAG: hypothetical protein Q4G39_10365 [Brachymonas sp.]|nr:hypothetical protein [Brachymonas sp.]